MKKAIHALLAFMLLLTFVIGCVGCDTDTDTNNTSTDRLSLSKSTLQLKVGEQAEISATGISSQTTVLWSSSNESVAIVSSSGNVVALSEGKAVITASTLPQKSTATCTVTVTKAAETVSITLSKTRLEMFVGDSETLSAMVLPAESNIKVAWSSSNTNVVTVKDGTVQAIAAGTSFIQAKAGDATAVCAVEVKEAFGSISGTITCWRNSTSKYEVDARTYLYLVPNDVKEINLTSIVDGVLRDRDDIMLAQVDALGNYKFDNIKLGTYRMIIVSQGGYDFEYHVSASSWIKSSDIPGLVKKALGDVYNRGTNESKNWLDNMKVVDCPWMQGFIVNVGKVPLTIIRTLGGIGAGTDVL